MSKTSSIVQNIAVQWQLFLHYLPVNSAVVLESMSLCDKCSLHVKCMFENSKIS